MGPKRRIGHGGSTEVGFPSEVLVSWSSCLRRQVSAWLCLRHVIPSRCPAMMLQPMHVQRACTDTLGAGRRRSDKAPDLAVDQDTTPWGSLPDSDQCVMEVLVAVLSAWSAWWPARPLVRRLLRLLRVSLQRVPEASLACASSQQSTLGSPGISREAAHGLFLEALLCGRDAP